MKVTKTRVRTLLKWIKELKAGEEVTCDLTKENASITVTLTSTKTRATSIETRLRRLIQEAGIHENCIVSKAKIYSSDDKQKKHTRDSIYIWEIMASFYFK